MQNEKTIIISRRIFKSGHNQNFLSIRSVICGVEPGKIVQLQCRCINARDRKKNPRRQGTKVWVNYLVKKRHVYTLTSKQSECKKKQKSLNLFAGKEKERKKERVREGEKEIQKNTANVCFFTFTYETAALSLLFYLKVLFYRRIHKWLIEQEISFLVSFFFCFFFPPIRLHLSKSNLMTTLKP